MKNLTLSLDESLIARARDHALGQGTSLDQLVGDLLEKELTQSKTDHLRSMFENADRMGLRSNSGYLTRDEAHERG